MTNAGRPLSISVRGVVGTLLVIAVVALCVRLGFWQLERLEQRRSRNTQVRARVEALPAQLTGVPRDSGGWLHRRVIVAGTFDNERSIVWAGRAHRGTPGVHVLTPVLLDNGTAVLADRGWVPAADGATVDLQALRLAPGVLDTALVLPFPGEERRLGEPREPSVVTRDRGFRRVWFALDPAAIRAQFPYELGAVHVRLLPAANARAFPLREPIPALADGPHLGYAIQWFCFALVAIVGWIALVMASLRRT